MARIDGRRPDEHRKTTITPGFLAFAEGSALIEMGQTRVICAATIEERVPAFLRSQGRGWVTAEYGMLPRSTISRTPRNENGRPGGRASEIQRLIGRSLRAITNMEALGERTVILDCDVLQADGGTRTAAITGAYVALYQATLHLVRQKALSSLPLNGAVAAISVGIVDGEMILDMCYEEDARADVDFNVVMTDAGEFVEIQGTAEGSTYDHKTMNELVATAQRGIEALVEIQRAVVKSL